jgi:hypothetical protein
MKNISNESFIPFNPNIIAKKEIHANNHQHFFIYLKIRIKNKSFGVSFTLLVLIMAYLIVKFLSANEQPEYSIAHDIWLPSGGQLDILLF